MGRIKKDRKESRLSRLHGKIGRKQRILLWCLLVLIFPLFHYIAAEAAMDTGCKFLSLSKFKIFMNCLYYGIAELFFLAITASFRGAVFGGAVFAAVFAATNIYLIRFTSIPIYITDLTNVGTAANVISNYDYTPNRGIWILILYLLLVGVLVFVVLPNVRICRRVLHKVLFRVVTIPLVIGILYMSCDYIAHNKDLKKKRKISLSTYKPIKSYRANGGMLTFMRSLKLLDNDVPEGYDPELLEALAQTYRERSEEDAVYERPNVIVIMNEAFADLQQVGVFETSEPVLPVYNSLEENTVKGDLYVSVFGGHTANSEYEFLSGDSSAFLPSGVTAYQVYIKSRFPGLASLLREEGYGREVAMHPFTRSSYNRNQVYNLMGFDTFLTVGNFVDPVLIRNYISDEADYDKIIEEYEAAKQTSDEPFFMFNVTMQNHSGYDADYPNLPRTITITSENIEARDQAERYLNLIHISDTQLGRLLDYFKQQDDPTVVVMFGDHQPGLPNAFYTSILGQKKSSLSDEESLRVYHTPFLIWANYDIQEKQDMQISANFLKSYMLECAGMEPSPYDTYLLELMQEIPVITARGCLDNQGNYFKVTDTKSEHYESILTYHQICYNHLFDAGNRSSMFSLAASQESE